MDLPLLRLLRLPRTAHLPSPSSPPRLTAGRHFTRTQALISASSRCLLFASNSLTDFFIDSFVLPVRRLYGPSFIIAQLSLLLRTISAIETPCFVSTKPLTRLRSYFLGANSQHSKRPWWNPRTRRAERFTTRPLRTPQRLHLHWPVLESAPIRDQERQAASLQVLISAETQGQTNHGNNTSPYRQ